MKRGLPGSDAWLSPPDPKVPPSGDTCIYVERGDEELEVRVWFDEGSVFKSEVPGRKSGWVPFDLTADEIQRAEEDWATREPEERDEPDDGRD